MQFKQYPSYKNSGVEWLGKVPEHWRIVRTKDIFNHRKEEALDDDEIVTAFRDGQVTLRKNRRTDGFTNSLKEHGYQHINSGDLVIHEMDAFAGAIGVSDSSGKSTPVYTVCYAKNENINHHFYSHFFRTMAKTGFINSLAKGIRVRSTEFRWNESRNVYLAEPPKADQEKIVSFLDTETARIDTLIAKQEKLIELLEEQRKSIISHAVTKGLNPNAPMKDSGVEWLVDVPEHWEVVKSKRLFWCKGGFAFSSDDFFEEGNYPVIRISNIQDKSISTDKIVYVNSCTKKVFNQFSAYTGDLIFCMTGASLGKVGLLPKELSFALINQRVGRLDITSYAIKQFVFYLVSSHGFQTNIRMLGVGLTDNFPNISSDLIGIVDVVLPPLVEQQGIVNHLEIENSKIDTLIEKQNQLIDKLKEYRASIISHAVTGKIDVREFGA